MPKNLSEMNLLGSVAVLSMMVRVGTIYMYCLVSSLYWMPASVRASVS